MPLRTLNGDVALPAAARGAGTYTSGSIGTGGAAGNAMLLVHCTAASGTTPTLNVSFEQSNDGQTGWTAVPNSGIPTLAAAGNAMSNAVITDDFVRVTATVAGTGPSFTFTASAVIFAE